MGCLLGVTLTMPSNSRNSTIGMPRVCPHEFHEWIPKQSQSQHRPIIAGRPKNNSITLSASGPFRGCKDT